MLREARPGALPALVEIHLESFRDFFLSFLGAGFLGQLYGAIIEDEIGISLVVVADGLVSGFVFGTTSPRSFYRRLLTRRWVRFGLASVGPAIRKPSIIARLLRAFNRPDQVSAAPGRATLKSIAVSTRAQGSGAGEALVAAFIEEQSLGRLLEAYDEWFPVNGLPVGEVASPAVYHLGRG